MGKGIGYRVSLLFLLFGSASTFGATISAVDAGGWVDTGRREFEHCHFKDAARAFTKALQSKPEDAYLHHWVGKSYARMAEVASPLHASRDARKARVSLERAVELEPLNKEYLRELFNFYLDSPEWFSGGLDRAAALVENMEVDDPGARTLLRNLLAIARQDYHGPTWRIRQATLLPSSEIGRIIP